ncbi:hypothetical protein CRUP_035823, partial [Coryphaenoides rupestris]
RLQEIQAKLDPRTEAKVRDGGLFPASELLRRRLIHEGPLLWKNPGSRLKDVQVLLMADVLVFLQEKDQRYIFPCLDKSPVLSLQKLIIRDIANQERGMFLISDSSPPEMYELHAASRDGKEFWMRQIHQAVINCPSREEFPLIETEDKALLRRLKADIQQKDREVLELLQERVTLFSDLAEVTGSCDVPLPINTRNLFRANTAQAPRAEKLLLDAIAEVDRLSEQLLGVSLEIPLSYVTDCPHHHMGTPVINGQEMVANGAQDSSTVKEICHRLMNLSAYLHALQGAVIKQDSILELCLWQEGSAVPTAGQLWRSLSRDSSMGESGTGAAIGELALLQRQHSLLQEELVRLRGTEGRLKDSEKARAQLERQVRNMAASSDVPASRATPQSQQGRPADPEASRYPRDQADELQDCSDAEEDDIPEETESGLESRQANVSAC